MEGEGFPKSAIRAVQEYIHWLGRSTTALIFTLFLVTALPLYVFYVAVILPVRHCDCNLPPADTGRVENAWPEADSGHVLLEQVKRVGSLEMEAAYLGSMLQLARQDSAYLSLDLSDSLLTILIKGVPVRSCPIREFRISRQIKCLDQAQLVHWITVPFVAQKVLSTIPKIRYITKQAPRDTIEAALMNAAPMPPDTSSVYYTAYFDRHLVLEVHQSEEPYRTEKEVIRRYKRERQQALRRTTMRALVHHTSPEPEILIRITVSKADARAVYRGIPVRSGVALRLPGRSDP